MANYKVLTIALAVKNNRVARFGEEVSESELTVNPSELVKLGALELLESDDDAIDIDAEVLETETETETVEEHRDGGISIDDSKKEESKVEEPKVDEKPLTAKDKAQAELKK